MDSKRVDALSRRLAVPGSRRSLLARLGVGLASTAGGAAGLDQVLAKRKGNGKGKTKGKVSLCHREGNGSFHFITVSSSARNAHLGHGDVECAPHPCRTYTGSCTTTTTTGVCDFTPASAGTACGRGQVCDASGNCV